MRSPRRAAWAAYTRLPIPPLSKKGGSSFANSTHRTVRAGRSRASSRASAITAALPLPLSSAPGDPSTVS